MPRSLDFLKMRVEGYRLALRLRRGARRASAFHALILALWRYDSARNRTQRPYAIWAGIRIEHSFERTFGVTP